jgi:hypothetical protein
MMVIVTVAAVSHIVALPTPLFSLRAVLTMFCNCIAQPVFGFVNVPVTPVLRPRGQGRTDQADDRQQGNAENSDYPCHLFSLDGAGKWFLNHTPVVPLVGTRVSGVSMDANIPPAFAF